MRRSPWTVVVAHSLLALGLALSLGAGSAARSAEPAEHDRGRLISLNSRTIDVALKADLPERLKAAPPRAGEAAYVLVKFPGPVTARQYAALGAATERIYTYLPYDTYLVRMQATKAASTATRAALGASWIGPYHPAYKLSKSLAALSDSRLPGDKRGSAYRQVLVEVYPDADLEAVRAEIEALGLGGSGGIAGARSNPFFSRLRLLLSPEEIVRLQEDLARIPEVFWVDLEPRRVLLNDTTVWVGQSGLAAGQTTPIFSQGIQGQGQTVAILDTGIDPDTCYFRDTARGLPPTNACNGGVVVDSAQRKVLAVDFLWQTDCNGGISSTEWDTQNHGTHVAGTVGGDNFANLLTHNPGDGMAPGAKLVIQDAGYQVDNCGDLPGIGCPVVDLNPIFQQAYSQGARLHSNSWGDNENATVQNNYTAGSQDVDEFMWNHKDFQIFFAAGNEGPGNASLGSPSSAKNVVAVGATQRGTAAEAMAAFSSCGPTDDGRIKPEITVPGQNIVSARNDGSTTTNNCTTIAMSGTSMATPGAAGLTALIRQYYTAGFYPSGAAVAANGITPSAALMRATLVNSAQSMTGATAIPANCQGWGRVLLENALFFTGQARKLFAKDDAPSFNTGSTNEDRSFPFTVAAGQSLKATLTWTDFPSTPAASPHINNDLDLIVTGPTGTIWRGNVFASGQSATGGAADRRNTLEQVLLNAPAAGVYTVTVRSFNVPNGPQPFALVVTGAVTPGGTQPPVTTVFADDFETDKGWTRNAAATDTATTGLWERGVPQTTNSGGVKQLATPTSGVNDLVTGRLAGAAAGDGDVDGGTTTIRSPAIVLPATGTLTLTLSYYFAHANNSSNLDFFRVKVIGTTTSTVIEELGSAANDDAAWLTGTASLTSFAGQTVRIQIEASDTSTASLVEAAVDDVKITQQ